MYVNANLEIQKRLEDLYGLPFEVKGDIHSKDPWFCVRPYNSDEDLFCVVLKIKNRLRIVIEVTPEKYAAFSISDMAVASDSQKKRFVDYARIFESLKAKIDFLVNDSVCDPCSPETWPEKWNKYKMRITRSPVISENDVFDEVVIVTEWAAIVTGMFLSLLNVVDAAEEGRLEGQLSRIDVNRYERNPVNRELCLAVNGYICKICGFDFEKVYGKIGHHFIHVHHIVPVSKIGIAYEIDPINDLIPVCPNCHAMLHRSDPPYSPEKLKSIISELKDRNNDRVL